MTGKQHVHLPHNTTHAAITLAEFAVGLRASDMPEDVRVRARDTLIDTVAASVFGHQALAGEIITKHVASLGSGPSAVLGASGLRVRAEDAALANGTLAHALEIDSLRKPGAGVHPGAVLVSAALAVAQESGGSGADVITAIIAGCEVLFRIGRATKHTAEARGFHAPGLTGPFGAAITAGRLLGLDAGQMANALGIAGSLGGGLLQFAVQGEGGMVKRLHLGRGAAAGITAAKLAKAGFTGPSGVLEGEMGFLSSYCASHDAHLLTEGLGEQWETRRVCFKRYACHITAHTPVQAVSDLMAEHGFSGPDVLNVLVEGTPKMADMHGNHAPADNVAAQYSIAFCVAAALFHDPHDPHTFTGRALADPAVMALALQVHVRGSGGFHSSWQTRTTIRLRDGREFSASLDDVPGMPRLPFTAAQMREKFLTLVGEDAAPVFERLLRIETESDLGWIDGVSHGIA